MPQTLARMRRLTAAGMALIPLLALAADVQRMEYEFQGIRLGGLLGPEMGSGCSCSFHYPPEGGSSGWALLSWDLGMDGQTPAPAHMFLDGRIERLAITQDIPPPVSRGTSFVCKLAGPRVSVELSLTTTSVCDGVRECDGTGYSGTMRVVRGTVAASVPVSGGCGC